MPKTILRYASLALFVFSVIQLALALSELIFNDVLSVAAFSSVFVTGAQNSVLTVFSGVVGSVCGFMGMLMSQNEANAITYRYFTTGLLLVYIAVDVIIFATAAIYPVVGIILLAVISVAMLYGIYKMTGKF